MHHDLKCFWEHFDNIVAKRKTFELRLNDRQFMVQDTVRLHRDIEGADSEESVFFKIAHIIYGPHLGGLRFNWCIISIPNKISYCAPKMPSVTI
jgi:hypothetical protein